MSNMYGITGIKVKIVYWEKELKELLKIHDGKIIDIRLTDKGTYFVIYTN